MNLRSLLLILAILVITTGGCEKKDPGGNPCNGLVNESPPSPITIKVIEKGTGNNLILSKKLQASDITVVPVPANQKAINWRVLAIDNSTSPFNGTIQFGFFQETPGTYMHQVKLGSLGTVTLAYTVTKTATDNECRPFYYPVSSIKITDYPFTMANYDGKSHPDFLVLEL